MTDAKVELGRLLSFDRRMSGDGLVSCATCHAPTAGWGDGNALSLGYPGTLHSRNSQTIINTAYLQKFWGGEKLSLEAQAKSAWTGNLAGNLDPAMAKERLRQMPAYVALFEEAFGAPSPSFDDALKAVAAFEATITCYPWDHPNCESYLIRLDTPAGGGVGPDRDVVAFNTLCTHMGVSLVNQFKREHQVLGPCPAHLSTYDLTRHGMVVSGHATEGLPQIVLEVEGDDLYATGVMGLIYGFGDNEVAPSS